MTGDFNGDGRTDLAVANSGSNDVSVLLGNGDGTFQPQVTYAVGNLPGAHVSDDVTSEVRADRTPAEEHLNRLVGVAGRQQDVSRPRTECLPSPTEFPLPRRPPGAFRRLESDL